MSLKTQPSSRYFRYIFPLVVGVTMLVAMVYIGVKLSQQETHYDAQKTQAAGFLPTGAIGQMFSWDPIFSEEFDGSTLDTTKWANCIHWGILDPNDQSAGCWENVDNWEWYLPANAQLTGGVLNLQTRQQTVTNSRGTFNYTSGMITTDRDSDTTSTPSKFSFTYGLVEMRATLPKGQGIWPALWLLSSDRTGGEIDVVELLGHEPQKMYMNYHYGNGQQSLSNFSLEGDDFSAGPHIFAVDWQPDAITWYVDGIARKTFVNAPEIMNKPMYLIANTQVGGPSTWPGAPDSTTFPTNNSILNYSIDYIRVWQRGASPTSTPTSTPTLVAPSLTPILSPTFTVTPLPTLSVTPGPTLVPTLTVVPTLTSMPTAMVTTVPTPISNPTPTSTSGTSSAPTCGNTRPASLSDLFQINVRDTTAQLFFTPVSGADEIAISYGTQPSAEMYGARIKAGQNGVQTVTIGALNPSTVYYFKVRGQNGCMPGDWSNTLRIVTRSQNTTKTTIFYKGGLPAGSALIVAARQISQISAGQTPIKGVVQGSDYSLLPSAIPTVTIVPTSSPLIPTPRTMSNQVPVTKQPLFWLAVILAVLMFYLLRKNLLKRDS